MSYADRCRICGQDDNGNDLPEPPDELPRWRIVREGDVVISWACDEHLAAECESLQRYWHPGETRLTVTMRSVDVLIEKLRATP
jgi:hypothetical protein